MGGPTLDRAFATVRRGGRIAAIKGEAPEGLAAEDDVHFAALYKSPNGAMLTRLADLIEHEALRPIVDSVSFLNDVQ